MIVLIQIVDFELITAIKLYLIDPRVDGLVYRDSIKDTGDRTNNSLELNLSVG